MSDILDQYRHQPVEGDMSFDDPGSVVKLTPAEVAERSSDSTDLAQQMYADVVPGRFYRPLEERNDLPYDGAHLQETPEDVRRKARGKAKIIAGQASTLLAKSVEWLAVDHPEVAAEYHKLLDEVDKYVERVEKIAENDR